VGNYPEKAGTRYWQLWLSQYSFAAFRADVGFELSKEYWGKGLASEALEAVINYGFEQLNLQRIQALIEPPNDSSQKLVERKGFIKEGLLRNYEFTCENMMIYLYIHC
jgi:RimJ/RimL family protein N-acetyltransferase